MPTYSEIFKKNVVEHYRTNRNIIKTARLFVVSTGSIYTWAQKMRPTNPQPLPEKKPAPMPAQAPAPAPTVTAQSTAPRSSLLKELQTLRTELKVLQSNLSAAGLI